MLQSKNFQFEADIAWEDLGNGIKRQLYGYNAQVMMVKVLFEAGAIGTMHQHPHVQVTYVEAGEFEMTIGAETKIIKAGDGYFVPPNITHGVKCLKAGLLVDTFAPMREDFLPQ